MCPASNNLASKLGKSSFLVTMIDTVLKYLVLSPNSSDVIKLVENGSYTSDLNVSRSYC